MDFSRDYLVHYYEADSSQRLTLPSLVQYFEDIAILHSASRGLDLAYYDTNHCGWMLLKWDITIRSLPTFGQTVGVGTKVNAIRKFLADRRFLMTASDGTVLAEGRSNWLFVDTDKRRPMRVPAQQFEYFSVAAGREDDFVAIDDVPLVPATVGSSLTSLDPLSVRVSHGDIDTNRHVNNVSYLDWSLDSLPHDFFTSRSPSRFRAQYRKELGIGNSASVVSVIDAASETAVVTRHGIRSGEDEFCSLEIGWSL